MQLQYFFKKIIYSGKKKIDQNKLCKTNTKCMSHDFKIKYGVVVLFLFILNLTLEIRFSPMGLCQGNSDTMVEHRPLERNRLSGLAHITFLLVNFSVLRPNFGAFTVLLQGLSPLHPLELNLSNLQCTLIFLCTVLFILFYFIFFQRVSTYGIHDSSLLLN